MGSLRPRSFLLRGFFSRLALRLRRDWYQDGFVFDGMGRSGPGPSDLIASAIGGGLRFPLRVGWLRRTAEFRPVFGLLIRGQPVPPRAIAHGQPPRLKVVE